MTPNFIFSIDLCPGTLPHRLALSGTTLAGYGATGGRRYVPGEMKTRMLSSVARPHARIPPPKSSIRALSVLSGLLRVRAAGQRVTAGLLDLKSDAARFIDPEVDGHLMWDTHRVYATSMTKKLVQHGDSAALIIDKPILDLLNMGMDTPLEITTDGRNIAISPATSHAEDELLASLDKINPRFSTTLERLAK